MILYEVGTAAYVTIRNGSSIEAMQNSALTTTTVWDWGGSI
jgi:hypothetical protein